MASQLVKIDQFVSMIATIQESMARLRQRIEEHQSPHNQVYNEARNYPVAPPPPPSNQQTTSHMPLVLHGQVEMTPPPAIVHARFINDTHARMDRLE